MSPAKLRNQLLAALALHRDGRLEEAGKMYAELRRAVPKNFDVVHLDGTLALQQGRLAEAVELLKAARRLDPKSAACAMRLGMALNGLLRFADAEASLSQAHRLDGRMPEIPYHRGFSLWKLGRLEEARACYESAIALSPSYAEAYDRLGALLVTLQGHAAAEPHFRKAVELQPRLATAWCNLGVCQTFLGRLTEALESFDRALAADPQLDHVHAGRGLALSKCYREADAIDAYERAITANPRNFEAHSARLCALQYSGKGTREALFREHRRFGIAAEEAARIEGTREWRSPGDSERRLRVAFLSQDLRSHSVAFFFEPILRNFDRSAFEIVLYHDHFRVDATSDRLRKMADHWRNFAGQSKEAVERQILSDAPDILVDLAGHSGLNRLPLFAARLAPLQVTYLGYPDTTGLAAMDCRLVDGITDPAGEADAFASERLVRFGPTAWAYDPPAAAPEPGPPREGPVAFGCFNNFSKVNDETLRHWSCILSRVDGSRLVLKGLGLGTKVLGGDIRRRMESAGIRADRVELLERTQSIEEHLTAYARIDIALDTSPYNGTTTTCEALWMGVPVLSLAGDRHASRVGASLLTAVGHSEWIAKSWSDYEDKAAALAARCREGSLERGVALRESMRRSPLLDHAGQSERFARALRALWREFCARPAAAA